jgi:hypothetical protein
VSLLDRVRAHLAGNDQMREIECVVRWHAQLRAGGDDAFRAMLALVHHDPERDRLEDIGIYEVRTAPGDLP